MLLDCQPANGFALDLSPVELRTHNFTSCARNVINSRELTMNRTFSCLMSRLALMVAVAALGTSPVIGQSGAKNGEWPTYGGDLDQTRYSQPHQITANN